MAPWTPTQLGSVLKVWLKADAITGLADGEAVASWADSSGNGKSAANATGAEQPTYQTGEINGLPVVRFDGTDDDLTITGHGLTKPCSIFVVTRFAGGNANADRMFHASNMYVMIGGSGTNDFIMNGGSDWRYSSDTLDTNPHMHSLMFAATGDSSGGFDGGVPDPDPAGTAAPGADLVLASTGSASWGAMDLAEIITVDGDLVTDTRQRVEGYLAHKWGLTANLPGDHPYKSAAPELPLGRRGLRYALGAGLRQRVLH